jgi:hypothetical protein
MDGVTQRHFHGLASLRFFPDMVVGELVARARADLRDKGPGYIIRFNLNLLITLLRYPFALARGRNRTFEFQGARLPYFTHWYNITYSNERAIEIPIALHFLAGYPPESILEVGNVLSHYGSGGHDTLDKFEKARGVIACDVLEFRTGRRYRRIVSISTIEHVGWDDHPRDPAKLPKAMDHLRSLLTPDGQILVTVPVGYNPEMDRMIDRGDLGFQTITCYRKTGPDNT